MMAHSLAEAYPGVPDDFPIIGPVIALLRRVAKPPSEEMKAKLQSIKPYFRQGVVEVVEYSKEVRAAWSHFLEKYYAITTEDWVSFEQLLARVQALPILIIHPVVEKFRRSPEEY